VASSGTGAVLDLVLLTGYPDAVCNDGTTAGYYVKKAAAPTDKWLIYLMGGMWCYDEATCKTRMQDAGFQTSSAKWQPKLHVGSGTGGVGGVFSGSDSNPFRQYNMVYLEYCSSDAWMGDVGASAATFNLNFRGQAIVRATMADLAAAQGLGVGSQVVFGGCSAGARGAAFLLDSIQPMLPAGSSVRGVLDSGLWVDITPMDTEEVSLVSQTQQAYALLQPQAIVSPACAAQYGGGEAWKCIYGVYAMPFVRSDYFISSSQFDDFQMLYDTGGTMPMTAGQVAYADEYQQATLSALQISVKAGQSVFSVTCLVHCLTLDTILFDGYDANGVPISQALAAWEGGQKSVVDISSCTGYVCVEQCPGGSQTYGINIAAANSAPAKLDAPPNGQMVGNVWVADKGPGSGVPAAQAGAPPAQGKMVNGVFVEKSGPGSGLPTSTAPAAKTSTPPVNGQEVDGVFVEKSGPGSGVPQDGAPPVVGQEVDGVFVPHSGPGSGLRPQQQMGMGGTVAANGGGQGYAKTQGAAPSTTWMSQGRRLLRE